MTEKQDIEFVNERLKYFIDDLDDKVEDIIKKTGIPRSTLYGMVKPGGAIKHENLYALQKVYGLDLNWLFEKSEYVPKNKTKVRSQSDPLRDHPGHPENIIAREPLTEWQIRDLRAFEQKVNELLERIENISGSPGIKMKLIDALLNIVENDLADLRAQNPDPDVSDQP